MSFCLRTPKLGFPQLWRPITFYENLWLGWNPKESYNLCRELSSNMWHTTYTQVNQGDSQLLVVKSQTASLTPNLFFCHNLCFKYPNVSCEHILDIKFQDIFNGIMKYLIKWFLTREIALWRFTNPSGFQFPRWGPTWECGGSFPHTLLHSREHEMWLPGFIIDPHLCKPLPCLGHKPKTKIATISII